MTDEPRTEWVDLREVAKELGVDRRLLITLAERGEFPEVLMLGPRIRKVRRDLYAIWLERNVIGPNPPYAAATLPQADQAYRGSATKDYEAGKAQDPSDTKRRVVDSIRRRGGANLRSVWTIRTQPSPDAHFATFPEALVQPCIKAGTKTGDTVLDPFLGSGTTALVANKLGRDAIGCELNPEYVEIARKRIENGIGLFSTVHVERPEVLRA